MRSSLYINRLDWYNVIDELDSKQWAQWEAFYQLEPFGCAVEDYRFARVANAVCNSQGGKTSVEDFVPQREPKRKDPGLAAKLRAIFGRGK